MSLLADFKLSHYPFLFYMDSVTILFYDALQWRPRALLEPGGKRCGVPPEIETISWQAPPFESSSEKKIAWIEEMIREGEGFLSGQACYKNLGANLRVFDAIFRDKSKSTLCTNQLKYNIRKFCETLAEVREIAGFGSDVPAYKDMAEMLTKVSKAVYLESDFPYQILKTLQYACVMGIGYLWPKVRASEYGYGPREMVFDALGLLDVIPVQIPARTNDIQDAYAVTIYDYMPVAEAYGKYSLFQGQLQTVGRNNYKSLIQAQRQDFASTWRYGEQQGVQNRHFGNLYCEIRYTFVRDLRINNTGYELPMGELGTSWFYKVPTIGQQIFGGMRNGQPYMRRAMAEDCRVYPNLRLIISSNGLDRPMYDGPAYDWDPKIPIIQYTVDDWAWEPLGKSLVGDVASIETTIRKHERKVDQVLTARLNPPMGYDLDNTGGPKVEHFDIFEEDVRLGLAGGKPKDTFQSILPDEVQVNSENWEFLKYLGEKELAQLGLNDVGNLQNMKLNIANDTADKMLEGIGPIAKGIAMRIERGNKKVGERIKYLIPQWFDTQRLIEYVGPDHIAREMFDFNPNDMVPSHLPDELTVAGTFPETPSMYDRLTRARWLVRRLRLISVPNTLLKITAMQRQLLLLQLKRGGAPLPWSFIMDNLEIENWGQSEGNTLKDKYFNEEEELQVMAIVAKAKAMLKLKEMGIDPSILDGGDGGGGGGKAGPGGKGGGGGQHGGGRPSSAQKSPKIKSKGGAGGTPRTVVSESG